MSNFLKSETKSISYFDGWHKLAQQYKAKKEFRGVKYKWFFCKLGIIHYKGSLTLGVNDKELFFSTNILIRLGHPDLIIPFADIRGIEHQGSEKKYILITFQKVPKARMIISKKYANSIERDSQDRWKYQRIKLQN